MKIRSKQGIVLAMALAVPIALAAELATRENSDHPASIDLAIVAGDAPTRGTASENVADHLKIYASF